MTKRMFINILCLVLIACGLGFAFADDCQVSVACTTIGIIISVINNFVI